MGKSLMSLLVSLVVAGASYGAIPRGMAFDEFVAPEPGNTVVLKNSTVTVTTKDGKSVVPVAVNLFVMGDVDKFITAGDLIGLNKLVEKEKAALLDPLTSARYLKDVDYFNDAEWCEVRLTEGPLKDQVVMTYRSSVRTIATEAVVAQHAKEEAERLERVKQAKAENEERIQRLLGQPTKAEAEAESKVEAVKEKLAADLRAALAEADKKLRDMPRERRTPRTSARLRKAAWDKVRRDYKLTSGEMKAILGIK